MSGSWLLIVASVVVTYHSQTTAPPSPVQIEMSSGPARVKVIRAVWARPPASVNVNGWLTRAPAATRPLRLPSKGTALVAPAWADAGEANPNNNMATNAVSRQIPYPTATLTLPRLRLQLYT